MGVFVAGREGARDVGPGGVEGEPRGQGDGDVGVVQADVRLAGAEEGEEEKEEAEAEVAAGGVAGEDDVRGGDRGVEGARGWGDEGEIGD